MPGFRGKNLRSGDLAEQLGLVLLQNVSLVTPVPRTEDVGIDAVATILRNYDSYNYVAEESFFIQLKSLSVSEIIYKDEQVRWLIELQLPLFIGIVDRKKSTIYIYSSYHLSDTIATNPDRKEIAIDLTNFSQYDCSDTNENTKIPIGPCVISWSFDTLESNSNFIDDFYTVLKPHIVFMKQALETRRVGYVESITWHTGQIPVANGTKIKAIESSEHIDKIAAPYITSFLLRLTMGKDIATTRTLYRLLEKTLEKENHFITIDGKRELIPYNANQTEQ